MTGGTLTDRTYVVLRDDIATGRIAPETALSERALTARLGVSRTPLRAALARLENEGMVDRLNNGVILVRSVSVEQLLQIAQLREHLESAAAARAAGFGTTDRLREIRASMQEIVEGRQIDFDGFWDEDGAFHAAVAEAARCTILPGIISDQRRIARRCRTTRTYDSFTAQAAEHVAIADAIAAGDCTEASKGMVLHFRHVRDRFLDNFA